ncbi:ankyrin repeat-containing domain protein [Tricladium varicosporioides]|nr:ankyrin repeat-containing domain protein [Hymenoscyphus varicosporioides]
MDPLTAISLAAAILQFVGYGIKVAKRLDELSTHNPLDVPKSLQSICTQLPLILNALGRIKSEANVQKLDFDTICLLRGVVSGCTAQVEEIQDIIEEVSRAPGDSFRTKVRKVFTSLKYDEKAWKIERNLHTYISILILHHVVDSADVPPPEVVDAYFLVREKRVSPFVDRPLVMKELEESLRDAAMGITRVPCFVNVVGKKGSGKTQLVLEYCHQVHALGQFQTVFWLDASTLETLQIGIENIYLTVKRSVDGSRDHKMVTVKGFLKDLWHPWLLILDNFSPSLYITTQKLLPQDGNGAIVFITDEFLDDHQASTIQIPRYLRALEQKAINHQFHEAIRDRDVQHAKELLSQGADVNSEASWNDFPCLYLAAMNGLDDLVLILLEQGANPHPPDCRSKPLRWAADNGHESTCRLLLKYEISRGNELAKEDYQVAFTKAAENGHGKVVEFLSYQFQHSFILKDSYGGNLFEKIARSGHVDVLKFLMSLDIVQEDKTLIGCALVEAANSGNFEIVKTICEQEGTNINVCDGQGNTALCFASRLMLNKTPEDSGEKVVQLLLDHGADPNLFKGDDGPLNEAAISNDLKVLRLLLSNGASIVQQTEQAGGSSPYHKAINYTRQEALDLLLQHEVKDKSARDNILKRCLLYASSSGKREAILSLLSAGVDINTTQSDHFYEGETPLLLAIKYEKLQVARLLVRKGARQDIMDNKGNLALPLAAKRGMNLLVRDLIRKGGDMDEKSGEDENTALHSAAAFGHKEVVRVLLEGGADREVENKFGEVAMDIAEEKGFKEVVELLEA